LKLLLLDPADGRLGLAASLDAIGSTGPLGETEVGVGLGAIGAAGPVTLRGSASVASTLGALAPHLHGGASAAVPLGSRLRALAEVVGEVGSGERSLGAGPTVKLALDERTAVAAGVLWQLVPARQLLQVTIQVSRSL
jgi:hypothetical protein